MIQEDKELLLVDLCGRLPYGVKVKYAIPTLLVSVKNPTLLVSVRNDSDGIKVITEDTYIKYIYNIEDIKPYLRPMSSMTKEEAKELLFVRLSSKYGEFCAYIKNFIKLNEVSFQEKPPYEGSIAVWFSFENKIHDTPEIREYSKREYLGQINDITIAEIDWLNAHHFDYRSLIEKGLAIEVTKDNNPYKE